MISKKKALIYGIILVMVTALVTSTFQLSVGNKVIVSKSNYEEYKNYSKLLGLKEMIEESYYKKPKEDELLTGSIRGMFEGLNDPYSRYYTEEEFKELMDQTAGVFSGVGIVIGAGEDNLITVVSPIEGSPAAKSGIKPGDKIIKVDGKNVTAKELDKATHMIKGKPGTDVTLTIKRENKDFDVTIKREEIKLQTVKSEVLEDSIGYIKITSFDETTDKDFEENINKLKEQNIKGLVLDLRGNPGGLLDVCHKIGDMLVGKGTIVYTKDNKGNTEYLKSDEESIGLPIAVLINGGSASASEILTGAIVDNKVGVAVGTTSFGKGLVQTVRELKDGTGYKLTIAQYFTPSGSYIHGKGIKPNIEVEDEAKQLDSAVDWIKEKIK
jgi:carboxyl-terminal processing protease